MELPTTKKVCIEDLLFVQRDIEQTGVDMWTQRIAEGEPAGTLVARYCHHDEAIHVLDGHHRPYALLFNHGIYDVDCDLDSCEHSDGMYGVLDYDDPCIIRDVYNLFSGSIYDLEIKEEDW